MKLILLGMVARGINEDGGGGWCARAGILKARICDISVSKKEERRFSRASKKSRACERARTREFRASTEQAGGGRTSRAIRGFWSRKKRASIHKAKASWNAAPARVLFWSRLLRFDKDISRSCARMQAPKRGGVKSIRGFLVPKKEGVDLGIKQRASRAESRACERAHIPVATFARILTRPRELINCIASAHKGAGRWVLRAICCCIFGLKKRGHLFPAP